MEHYLLVNIPFEIGSIRIFRLFGNQNQVFEKMKMVILDEFNETADLDKQLESKGYKVNKESGIIFNKNNEWKLVPESEIINL